MFLNQIFNIFHKKSKSEQPKRKTDKISSSPPITEEERTVASVETIPTSVVSNSADNQRPTSSTTFSLPEVEFEESRNLLKLDFFSDSSNEQRDISAATFPKFDYLLQEQQAKTQESDKSNRDSVKKRKLSTTLRHRISQYKPNKSVKRTMSTPHLAQ